MNRLVTERLSDCFRDQRSKLPLCHVPLMEYHAANNDPIDCIHLRKTAIDFLLENAIRYFIFRPPRISNLLTNRFQSLNGNKLGKNTLMQLQVSLPKKIVITTVIMSALILFVYYCNIPNPNMILIAGLVLCSERMDGLFRSVFQVLL